MVREFPALSAVQQDALREVFNIGVGNAATALSQLLRTRVEMMVPAVRLLPLSATADQIGGPEKVVAGIYLNITGMAGGSLLFCLTLNSATNLVKVLLGGEPTAEDSDAGAGFFGAMEQSALLETGNILAHAFLNSIADLSGLILSASVPDLAIDMAGAVLSIPLLRASQNSDYALVLNTQLAARGETFQSQFLLLPDLELLNIILEKLQVFEHDYAL